MSQTTTDHHLKFVTIGDGSVGKTSLLHVYAKDRFPEQHVHAQAETYSVNAMLEGQSIHLGLWDTEGQEEFDRLRPFSYPGTSLFLICFSVVKKASYNNVLSKWVPEVSHHCKHVPFILVGTQIDLREDEPIVQKLRHQGELPLSTKQGEQLQLETKAVKYVECSAYTQQNVRQVFNEAIRAVLFKQTEPLEKKGKCELL